MPFNKFAKEKKKNMKKDNQNRKTMFGVNVLLAQLEQEIICNKLFYFINCPKNVLLFTYL